MTAYFARRRTDPQAVADLTATFTAAISSFGTFDPRNASPWNAVWAGGALAGFVGLGHGQPGPTRG